MGSCAWQKPTSISQDPSACREEHVWETMVITDAMLNGPSWSNFSLSGNWPPGCWNGPFVTGYKAVVETEGRSSTWWVPLAGDSTTCLTPPVGRHSGPYLTGRKKRTDVEVYTKALPRGLGEPCCFWWWAQMAVRSALASGFRWKAGLDFTVGLSDGTFPRGLGEKAVSPINVSNESLHPPTKMTQWVLASLISGSHQSVQLSALYFGPLDIFIPSHLRRESIQSSSYGNAGISYFSQ